MKNKKAAKDIPHCAEAHVTRLLRYHGITLTAVIAATDSNWIRIRQILDLTDFQIVDYGQVVRSRAVIEQLLRQAGWEGEPADLWREFDERLRSAA